MAVTLLVLGSVRIDAALSQDTSGFQLSGTAVNTTNSENPLAAPLDFAVRNGVCVLTVSPPLTGSGPCNIKSFDKGTGKVEILSLGPPTISWSGTLKGNLFIGVYRIDLGSQNGYFYLALLNGASAHRATAQAPIPEPMAPRLPRRGCTPAIESSIDGEINGWAGETVFKLTNGQIWQQAEADVSTFYEYQPDVTIYETTAGCRMKVEDEEDTVIVKRIK